MPLRKFSVPRPFQPTAKANGSVAQFQGKSLWRTGLVLASSAALGGIALAIWNRRALAQFRQFGQD